MRDKFESRENAAQPWESDGDAWRRAAESSPDAPSWPQLDAGPAYWMWLAVLETERGITS